MKKSLFYALFINVLIVLVICSCKKEADSTVSTPEDNKENRINFTFDAGQYSLSTIMPGPKKDLTPRSESLRRSTCGSHLFSYHTSTGYYSYAYDTLDLTATPVGATVRVAVNANYIPNRFSVYTTGWTLLATSGWMGYASYSGPWGPSINTAITGTLTFTRGASAIYILKTETSFPSGGGQEDAWNASVLCHVTGCSGNPCTCTCSCP